MSESKQETLTTKAVAGVSWSMIATIGRQVITFGSIPILARILGPETYGLMSMAAVVTAFLINFRDLGTAAAVIQRATVSDRLLSTVFWINLFIGLLLGLIVAAIALPASVFYKDPRVAPVLLALAISFPLTSAGTVHQALLSRQMSFRQLAIADFGSAFAGYLVAIPCALMGFGVWSLVGANLANALVSTLLMWIVSPWRPSFVFDRGEIYSIRKFSLNLSGFGILNYASRNADNLIVGRFLGSVPLGFYQMAYNLMLYPLQNITSVISQVLFPAFAQIGNDDERFRNAYTRSCLLIALVTFPVMAGLGVVADPLVRALLGSRWLPAIPVFQILAPVGMLQSVVSTVGQIYIVKGRTDWMFRWGIYSSAVYVISFLIGVPFGISGVAASYSICFYCLILFPVFAIPFRLIGLSVRKFAQPFILQLAATAAMVLGCYGYLHLLTAMQVNNDWVRLITTVVVGTGLYVFGILWSRPAGLLHMEELVERSNHRLVPGILSISRVLAKG